MIIRQAKKEDQQAIIDLMVRSFTGVSVAEVREKRYGIIGGKSWQEIRADEIANHPIEKVIVAEENGQLIGFATYSMSKLNKIGSIGYNGVDPKWRSKGIGTKLIEEVLRRFRNEGMKFASVGTGLGAPFAPARRMYEKVGFEVLQKSVTYFMRL